MYDRGAACSCISIRQVRSVHSTMRSLQVQEWLDAEWLLFLICPPHPAIALQRHACRTKAVFIDHWLDSSVAYVLLGHFRLSKTYQKLSLKMIFGDLWASLFSVSLPSLESTSFLSVFPFAFSCCGFLPGIYLNHVARVTYIF